MLPSPEKAAVAADLAYLRKWLAPRSWRDAPPQDEIRLGSLVLRRLLLEREIVGVWHAVGFPGEPDIVAVDLLATVAAQGPGAPEFALAGSARLSGSEFQGVPVGKAAPKTPIRVWPLSKYLESPSILLGRTAITRREVIKYVAHLNGAPEAPSAKGRKQEQEFATRMARLEARANTYRPSAFQLELYSIGQTLAQTPDAVKLAEALG